MHILEPMYMSNNLKYLRIMKSHYLFAALLGLAVCFTSCNESAIYPGDNAYNQDSIYVVPPMQDPTDSATVAALASVPDSLLINVTKAREICAALGAGGSTSNYYYVKGWICDQDASKNAEAIEKYGNVYFYMGVSSKSETKHALYAYQVLGLDKKKILSTESVQVGDFVIVKCRLKNYNNVYETVDKGDGNIYYSTNPQIELKPDTTNITPDPAGANVPADAINVYQALKIGETLATGTSTSETYYIKGWVCNVTYPSASDLSTYGNMTLNIAATNDGTADMFSFYGYRVKSVGNTKFTNNNQMQVGDFVVIQCKIKNYNGTIENDNGAYLYSSNNPNLK